MRILGGIMRSLGLRSSAPGDVWPGDMLRERVELVAAQTWKLLADETRWVHRRVEKIALIDDRRVHRHTSVDFTMPHLARSGDGAVDLIPLSLVHKEVLRDLDVRDEEGNALPVLTREQNATIAGAILVQQASVTLEELGDGTGVNEELRADLKSIAGERSHEDAELFSDEAVRQWALLLDDPTMSGLLTDFEKQFILFADARTAPGQRRVLKFSYEQAFDQPPRGGGVLSRLWGGSKRKAHNLLESLGLRSFRAGVGVTAMLDAESYHVEVAPPEDAVISFAQLVRIEEIPEEDDGGASQERRVVLDTAVGPGRVHLYTSEAHPSATTWSLLEVYFRLRAGVLWPVFLISAVTSGLFGAGLYLHSIDVPARADAAAALIVALPAFFAPAVAPGGHALVRRMFRGLRVLVWVSALLSFVAGASLAVDLSASTMERAWWVLLAISSLLTIIAGLSLLFSTKKSTSPSDA